MIYGYARVSTDGQTVGAQVEALTAAGAAKVFRETASGAQTDRTQLHKVLWIDADPPFSAAFTLWLSTIHAVGLASRSANSRHLM
jgi:predicted site-specific integrase-resolvase